MSVNSVGLRHSFLPLWSGPAVSVSLIQRSAHTQPRLAQVSRVSATGKASRGLIGRSARWKKILDLRERKKWMRMSNTNKATGVKMGSKSCWLISLLRGIFLPVIFNPGHTYIYYIHNLFSNLWLSCFCDISSFVVLNYLLSIDSWEINALIRIGTDRWTIYIEYTHAK